MWWLIIPVAIYSLGILWLWSILVRNRDEAVPASGSRPRVSVVVACRNEEKTITTLLRCLAGQDYPKELLEIIIVNDRSTDRTPVAVSEFIDAARLSSAPGFRLIYNTASGKKSAIRLGVRSSSGELILTTDADCVVGSGWVSAMAGCYAATGADMLLGEVYQRGQGSFALRFGVLEFSALQAVSQAAVLSGYPVMCNGANMGFRKEIYMRHSGDLRDDLVSGDDIFLLHAVSRAGGKVVYAGSRAAAAETAAAVSAAALLRQRARWASKSSAYRDTATITLAAATAACNAAVAAATIAALFSHNILLPATLYAIRLIPDYLIINHNIKKREGHMPLPTFIISELIYPFYFMTVAIISMFPSSRRFNHHN
ncbi:MAG: glycosyltransferase [Bacteroidales bacterium]|jgi:cellulose synthase/poly-beta-1,6-N-acetylglucosamine synthase-like glycosyltransferase|nr:glycosyltransferase [Bacteroidales bacterium]